MEGIASETASLAGAPRLRKLIFSFFMTTTKFRLEAKQTISSPECPAPLPSLQLAGRDCRGWHGIDAIERAIHAADVETARPSLIAVRNHLGYRGPSRLRPLPMVSFWAQKMRSATKERTS
jgi:transketolase